MTSQSKTRSSQEERTPRKPISYKCGGSAAKSKFRVEINSCPQTEEKLKYNGISLFSGKGEMGKDLP